jgi:hypothetical protein
VGEYDEAIKYVSDCLNFYDSPQEIYQSRYDMLVSYLVTAYKIKKEKYYLMFALKIA